jgi:hypothetical protein
VEDHLSPRTTNKETRADLAVAGIKAALSYIPGVGPIVAELFGVLIPNQRMDRVTEMVAILWEKVGSGAPEVFEQRMKTPEWIDLFEDGAVQAARSLTTERRKQIASALKNSLYHGETDYLRDKKLLALLNELNYAQLIMLNYYARVELGGSEEYQERHRDVLCGEQPTIDSPIDVIQQAALRDAYQSDLERLGLLAKRFSGGSRELPPFDPNTGTFKMSYLAITTLGLMLLEYIDMHPVDDTTS